MKSLVRDAPAWDIARITSSREDISVILKSLEVRFQEAEAEIKAFVPAVDRFARLLDELEGLYESFPDPATRPPLFGVLAGVKDIFQVDGFKTHAGSRLPPEILAGAEGRAVRRLREAGALILGKTVTTEFAYFGPGPTRNPHNLAHTPGGSSSGSAAAVAAGLAELTLGTQTIGSVIRPAAFCGVYGFKPSYGRIPTSGVIPLSPSLDHVGLFSRSLSLLTRGAQATVAGWRPAEGAESPVLGIPEGPFLDRVESDGMDNFNQAVAVLESSGIQVKRVGIFDDFEAIVDRHYLIVAAEAARVHEEWYDTYKDRYHQKTRELIELGRKVAVQELVLARSQRTELRQMLGTIMDAYSLDYWIAPSAPGPAPAGLDSTGDPVMNLPWTQAGLPALNLPSGHNDAGLPFGLQVIGRFGADEQLLVDAPELDEALDLKLEVE